MQRFNRLYAPSRRKSTKRYTLHILKVGEAVVHRSYWLYVRVAFQSVSAVSMHTRTIFLKIHLDFFLFLLGLRSSCTYRHDVLALSDLILYVVFVLLRSSDVLSRSCWIKTRTSIARFLHLDEAIQHPNATNTGVPAVVDRLQNDALHVCRGGVLMLFFCGVVTVPTEVQQDLTT